MQAIRQIYEDAPPAIPIPEAFQRKRVEVILLVQEEGESSSPARVKSLLAAMPDVGEDADFARQRDYGQGRRNRPCPKRF